MYVMGKFVIKKTNTGIKFDLKAGNGQVIATSEVYILQMQHARTALQVLRRMHLKQKL